MKRLGKPIVSLFLAFVSVLSAGLAAASPSEAVASGPADARPPATNWQPLSSGEEHWYSFTYAGDGSEIEVRLQVAPANSVGLAVWTPEQMRRWGLGEYVEPIGRGSADPYSGGSLVWTGSFYTAGTYHVVVEGQGPGQSYYLLGVDGSGVSLEATDLSPSADLVGGQAQSQAAATPPGEPTGTLVFQTAYGGTFYSINVDGTELRPITAGIDPVWSPSGDQVAFVRWEEPRGVWVVNADGTGEQRLFDWSETRYPSWSPDGEQIVFSRQHGGTDGGQRCFRGRCFTVPATENWRLGIVNLADDSLSEPETEKKVAQTPSWSPSGDRTVYHGGQGLVISSADGKTEYQLTGNPTDTSPVWSRVPPSSGAEGDQVAFVRRQHDHWEIYVVDVDTGRETRLTDTPVVNSLPANSVSPAWSPEGNYIAFLTDRTGVWEVWIMDADGSSARSLFEADLSGLTLDYAFAGERAIDWTW